MEDNDTLPCKKTLESSAILQDDVHLSSSDDESIVLSEVGKEETPSTPPGMEDEEPGYTLGETMLEVLSNLSVIQDFEHGGKHLVSGTVMPTTDSQDTPEAHKRSSAVVHLISCYMIHIHKLSRTL